MRNDERRGGKTRFFIGPRHTGGVLLLTCTVQGEECEMNQRSKRKEVQVTELEGSTETKIGNGRK